MILGINRKIRKQYPKMPYIWSQENVIAAIHAEALAGHELSYSRVEKRVPSLLRAAQRAFGSWAEAVGAAGYDYSAIRRYRKWNKEKVVERIRELSNSHEDLSWRNVSTKLDAPLAAAALHGGRFANWNEALEAAGLNPAEIMRYRKWSLDQVRNRLRELALAGEPLDRDSLAESVPSTLAAIYRIGDGLVAERNVVLDELLKEGHDLPYPQKFGDESEDRHKSDRVMEPVSEQLSACCAKANDVP